MGNHLADGDVGRFQGPECLQRSQSLAKAALVDCKDRSGEVYDVLHQHKVVGRPGGSVEDSINGVDKSLKLNDSILVLHDSCIQGVKILRYVVKYHGVSEFRRSHLGVFPLEIRRFLEVIYWIRSVGGSRYLGLPHRS